MNLLSCAETVKGKRTLSKATRLCAGQTFPVMCPRRGSKRNLSCSAWMDFSRWFFFRDFPLIKTVTRPPVFCTQQRWGSWEIGFTFYLRLLRSRSSVSKSRRGCGVSLGPCDCSTEELEEMTVVWPEGWMVLNWNWGPIHRRRWGPVWVTISTCGKGRWAGINTSCNLV